MGIRFHLRQSEMQAIERAETQRLLDDADAFFDAMKRRKPIEDVCPRFSRDNDA